ncbi:MAG: DivIVA domain-containing protein [Streptosporangiales bacterium]
MPLTPAEVRNKQFNTTRLRPGYDEEEVDSFLDEVEAELDRLITENDELRRRLAEATGDQSYLSGPITEQQGAVFSGQRQGGQHGQHGQPANGVATGTVTEAPPQGGGQIGHTAEQPRPLGQGPPDQQQGQPTQQIQQTGAQENPPYGNSSEQNGRALNQQQGDQAKNDGYTPGHGSHAAAGANASGTGMGGLADGLAAAAGTGQVPDSAARLLALAQQVHDEHVATAQQKSDETLRKARAQADKLVADARRRAEDLDRDAQEKHRQAMGSMISEREKLEQQIETLRTFEREYRSRLKSYLQGQLEQLEKTGSQAPPRLGE